MLKRVPVMVLAVAAAFSANAGMLDKRVPADIAEVEVSFRHVPVDDLLAGVVPPAYRIQYEAQKMRSIPVTVVGRGPWPALLNSGLSSAGLVAVVDVKNAVVKVINAKISAPIAQVTPFEPIGPQAGDRGPAPVRAIASPTDSPAPVPLSIRDNDLAGLKQLAAQAAISQPEKAPTAKAAPANLERQPSREMNSAPANIASRTEIPAPSFNQQSVAHAPPVPAPPSAPANAELKTLNPAAAAQVNAVAAQAAPAVANPAPTVIAVPSAVGVQPAAVATPAEWPVLKGSTFEETLADWAKRSGWQLRYEKDAPKLRLLISHTFRGSMPKAVTDLVVAIRLDSQYRVTLNEGNQLIHVHAR